MTERAASYLPIMELWKLTSLTSSAHLRFGFPDPHLDFLNSNYYYYSLLLLNEDTQKKRLNINYQFGGQV